MLALLAAVQSRHLAAVRKAGLPEAYAGYSANVPPALTFILAGLGGFRGLASEVLWFRAERLQDEGRYMELVQLSDWLTRLDPHAAEAWIYNAWNLTYNISVMMIRPEDRLRWVKNGISLLRDDSLRFNPREGKLYRELAWMYLNKIGDSLDNCHLAYKRDLAMTVAPCLDSNGSVLLSADARAKLAALHLDADFMAELEKRYGSLDWRIAESHALYWASRGLPYTKGNERLMTRRIIYQSLMLSIFHGRLACEPDAHAWRTARNLPLALPAANEMASTLAEFPSRNMSRVYLRFLASLAAIEKHEGSEMLAQLFYKRLLTLLPAGTKQPTLDEVIEEADKSR